MEDYRPIYHFTAQKGWINDPNGLFVYKNKYHMCFQHNPASTNWENIHWGHATTDDFIKWEQKEDVISPTEDFQCFSGSAVVDYENVSGLKEGEDAPILLFFTGSPKGQFVSYSTDGGENFKVYGRILPTPCPIDDIEKIRSFPKINDRDPNVFWCEESGKWAMVLYTVESSRTKGPAYSFYSSEDLLNWEYESEIPLCFEMPYMLKLPCEEDYKYVLLSANGDYRVGDFDGHKLIPCQELNTNQRLFGAVCGYSWKNEGRVTQVSWLYTGRDYSNKYKNFYTVPVDLSLRKRNGKYELLREPVPEINKYKKEFFSLNDCVVMPGENPFPKGMFCPEACEIEVELEYNPFNIVWFDTGCGKVWYKAPDNSILYNSDINDLFFNGIPCDLDPKDGVVKYKIFVDRTSIEIFADDGYVYMPFASVWKKQQFGIGTVADPIPLKIRKLKVYEIKV